MIEAHYEIRRINEQYTSIDLFDSTTKLRVFFLLDYEVQDKKTKKEMLALLRREYPTTTSFYKEESLERFAECFLVARDELIDMGDIQQ